MTTQGQRVALAGGVTSAAERLVELLMEVLLVMKGPLYRIDVTEQLLQERARSAAETVLGEFSVVPRDPAAPMLVIAEEGARVLSFEAYAPDEHPRVEVARLSIFELKERVQFSTADAGAVAAALLRAAKGTAAKAPDPGWRPRATVPPDEQEGP